MTQRNEFAEADGCNLRRYAACYPPVNGVLAAAGQNWHKPGWPISILTISYDA